jgi:YggT family protein
VEMLVFSLYIIVELYSLIILARVLLSWVPSAQNTPLAQAIFNMTEPVLQPIRNALPQTGGFDFSPIIAIVLMQVVMSILQSLL